MLEELLNLPKRKIYLSITHGKIAHTTASGMAMYSKVGGTLEDIYLKERSFNGTIAKFWYIELRDNDELYSISFPYASGTFKSIILSLASDELLSEKNSVVIEPYEKNGYTKVVVYSEGVKLDWVTKELPPVADYILPNGESVKDDGKRMEFIINLVHTIQDRLQRTKRIQEV